MNENDPRVKRTRKLLRQALVDLLREQSFQEISVQDIAARATLNRATFYAHYEDKYDLIDSVIRADLQQSLAQTVPVGSAFTPSAMRTLCHTVFACLAQVQDHCKPSDRQFDPLFDQAVQEVLYSFLLRWLAHGSPAVPPGRTNRETVAAVMSWSIFGAGAMWSRGERSQTAEELAAQVVKVLICGVAESMPTPVRDQHELTAASKRASLGASPD